MAIRVLCTINYAKALPVLIETINELGNKPQRIDRVANAIASIRDPAALEDLHILLSSPDRWFRLNAAYALRAIADEKSMPFLAKALVDSDPEVRYYAATGLAAITGCSALYATDNSFKQNEEQILQFWQGWYERWQRSGGRAKDWKVSVTSEPEKVRLDLTSKIKLTVTAQTADAEPAEGPVTLYANFGEFMESKSHRLEANIVQGKLTCTLSLVDAPIPLPCFLYIDVYKFDQRLTQIEIPTRRPTYFGATFWPRVVRADGKESPKIAAQVLDEDIFGVEDLYIRIRGTLPDGRRMDQVVTTDKIGNALIDIPPMRTAGEALFTVEVLPVLHCLTGESLSYFQRAKYKFSPIKLRLLYVKKRPALLPFTEVMKPWSPPITWDEKLGRAIVSFPPHAPAYIEKGEFICLVTVGQDFATLYGNRKVPLPQKITMRKGQLLVPTELMDFLLEMYPNPVSNLAAAGVKRALHWTEWRPIIKIDIDPRYMSENKVTGLAGKPLPITFHITDPAGKPYNGDVEIYLQNGGLLLGSEISPYGDLYLRARPKHGVVRSALQLIGWNSAGVRGYVNLAHQSRTDERFEIPRANIASLKLAVTHTRFFLGSNQDVRATATITDAVGKPLRSFPVCFNIRQNPANLISAPLDMHRMTGGDGKVIIKLPKPEAPAETTIWATAGDKETEAVKVEWVLPAKNAPGIPDLQPRLATLEDQFRNTTDKDTFKTRVDIAHQAIALGEPGIRLACQFMEDPRYEALFPSAYIRRNLNNLIALELAKTDSQTALEALRRYYYDGERSHKIDRTTPYEFKFNWQKPAATAVDEKGNHWALIYLWWYGSYGDIWLTHSQDMITWSPPLFTGIVGYPFDKADQLPQFTIRKDKIELTYLSPPVRESTERRKLRAEIAIGDLTLDSDNDGLYDIEEQRFNTNPQKADTDGDGLGDGEDLNPLVGKNPKKLTDAQAIRQAIFRRKAIDQLKILVVQGEPEERQEYVGGFGSIILPMSRQELDDLRKKTGCSLHVFIFEKIEINKSRDRATVAFTDYSGFHAATMYSIELRKSRGVWVVVDDRVTGIS